MHLVDNLKYLRNREGITQRYLAELLYLTRNQVVSYEDGRAQPAIETLMRMADFYQVSLDNLIRVKINQYNYNEIFKNSAA